MTYRVLIVEDSKVAQDELTDILGKQLGYAVTLASTYTEALHLLRTVEDPYDLITVDINLDPGEDIRSTSEIDISGLDIIRYIEENNRGEVCCVISGEKFTVDFTDKLGKFSVVREKYPKGRGLRNKLITDIPKFIAEKRRRNKRIFISYRRADTQDIAMSIRRELVRHFGTKNVYIDVHNARVGQDFRDDIRSFISTCDVMLVVIGQKWLDITDEAGARRLDDSEDMLRIEIAEGLKLGIPVTPILVHGARVPRENQLPADLAKLVYLHGSSIRSDEHFENDIDSLIRRLES